MSHFPSLAAWTFLSLVPLLCQGGREQKPGFSTPTGLTSHPTTRSGGEKRFSGSPTRPLRRARSRNPTGLLGRCPLQQATSSPAGLRPHRPARDPSSTAPPRSAGPSLPSLPPRSHLLHRSPAATRPLLLSARRRATRARLRARRAGHNRGPAGSFPAPPRSTQAQPGSRRPLETQADPGQAASRPLPNRPTFVQQARASSGHGGQALGTLLRRGLLPGTEPPARLRAPPPARAPRPRGSRAPGGAGRPVLSHAAGPTPHPAGPGHVRPALTQRLGSARPGPTPAPLRAPRPPHPRGGAGLRSRPPCEPVPGTTTSAAPSPPAPHRPRPPRPPARPTSARPASGNHASRLASRGHAPAGAAASRGHAHAVHSCGR